MVQPPFNIKMATNVAKTFLTLIDKHFPKNKKLSKFFNRNTIKVIYSCLPNKIIHIYIYIYIYIYNT